MPRTNFHRREEHIAEQLFRGRVSFTRVTSFFYYHKGSGYNTILHQLKYKGNKELAVTMGRYMASELLNGGFFQGMDMIVPVPLHPKKLKQRGYNQSEQIARGISAVTGIPVMTSDPGREKNTDAQIHKSAFERNENVKDVFKLQNPLVFAGKHLLIVDDVLTTGATITACALSFQRVEGVKLSALTLALAG